MTEGPIGPLPNTDSSESLQPLKLMWYPPNAFLPFAMSLPPCVVVEPPASPSSARGITTTRTRGRKQKTLQVGGHLPRGEIPPTRIRPSTRERGHHLAREPAQLFLELLGRQALGPMDHEVLEPRIFRLDRLDAFDDVRGRAAEPRLLRDAVGEIGHARGSARRPPRAALLVGVAHEAERREPLVALVVRRLELADGLLLAAREIDAGAPDHVLAELLRAAVPLAGGVIGAHHVVQYLRAVERDHRLEA